MNVRPSRTAGLTLLELLVGIAILIVLAGVAIVAGNSARMRAYNTQALVCGEQIRKAQTLYYSEKQAFADSFEKLDPKMVGRCALVSVVEVTATPQGYTYTVAHARGNTKYTIEDDRASQTVLAGGAENAAGASDTSGGGQVVGVPDNGDAAPEPGKTYLTVQAAVVGELTPTFTVTGPVPAEASRVQKLLQKAYAEAIIEPDNVLTTRSYRVNVTPGTWSLRVALAPSRPQLVASAFPAGLSVDYPYGVTQNRAAPNLNTRIMQATCSLAGTGGSYTVNGGPNTYVLNPSGFACDATASLPATASRTLEYRVVDKFNDSSTQWANVNAGMTVHQSSNVAAATYYLVVADASYSPIDGNMPPPCLDRCWETNPSVWSVARTGRVAVATSGEWRSSPGWVPNVTLGHRVYAMVYSDFEAVDTALPMRGRVRGEGTYTFDPGTGANTRVPGSFEQATLTPASSVPICPSVHKMPTHAGDNIICNIEVAQW